jgi:biotin carboxylase
MSSFGPPTVVCADLTSWEGMVQFGAALTRHGVRVVRFTGRQRSRRQLIRTTLERVAFSATAPVLATDPVGAVDVTPILAILDDLRDVQSADIIGSELAASEKWRDSPRLHRVHAAGLTDLDVYDKLAYTRLAEAVGVSVPETWAALSDVPGGIPVVVKTRLGSGGTGVRLVADAAEIPAAVADLQVPPEAVMYQQRIPGQVWNVGGVADRGEVVAAGAYRGIPADDDPLGPPVETLIVDRPDLLAAAQGLVGALGYRGLFQIDFLCDDQDGYFLIDLNPRIWGSWAGLQAAGVDVLGNYLRLLGAQITPTTAPLPIGRRFCTSAVGPSSIRQTVARTRRLTGDIGPVLSPTWRALAVTQAASTARPSWLARGSGDADEPAGEPDSPAIPASTPDRAFAPGPAGGSHVTFANSEPWRAAISFSAALRHRGVPTRRHITPHEGRMQQLRVSAESLCFSSTVFDIEVTSNDRVLIDRPEDLLSAALDVQATERIAEYLFTSGVAQEHQVLSRVGAGVDPRVTFDKGAATSWARSHGIATAEVFRPNTAEDLAGRFPVVVKHPTGYGGKWVRICHSVAEVCQAADDFGDQLSELLIEEFLPGEAVNVGGVAHLGEVLTAAAYRPQPRPGSPTGPPVSVTLITDPEAMAVASRIVTALGLNGPFCVDLVAGADGKPRVLDVNTRVFSSWLGLERAGYDIVANYLWTLGLGDRPAPRPGHPGNVSGAIPVDVVAGLGLARTLRHNARLVSMLWSATGPRGALAGCVQTLTKLRHG